MNLSNPEVLLFLGPFPPSGALSDQHVFDEAHGAFLPSPGRAVAAHPLLLTFPAHQQQNGAAAAQQHRDTDDHRHQQSVSGHVPSRSELRFLVLHAMVVLAACSVVPLRAARCVVSILRAGRKN